MARSRMPSVLAALAGLCVASLLIWFLVGMRSFVNLVADPKDPQSLALRVSNIEDHWHITVPDGCTPEDSKSLTDPSDGEFLTLQCAPGTRASAIAGAHIPEHFDAYVAKRLRGVINRTGRSVPLRIANYPTGYVPEAIDDPRLQDPSLADMGLYASFDEATSRLYLFEYSGGYMMPPSSSVTSGA